MQVCHCISCRKTGGAYCVNLAAEKKSLKVEGRNHVKSYRYVVALRTAQSTEGHPSELCMAQHKGSAAPVLRRSMACRGNTEIATERFFCGTCGSMLWGEDNRYPQCIYPAASCLDTTLPRESHICIKPSRSLLWWHHGPQITQHKIRRNPSHVLEQSGIQHRHTQREA